jgi:hypothetical protein
MENLESLNRMLTQKRDELKENNIAAGHRERQGDTPGVAELQLRSRKLEAEINEIQKQIDTLLVSGNN